MNIKKIKTVIGICLLVFISCTDKQPKKTVETTTKKAKPNIVWLIAEDLSPDLGCYGNTLVSTPNVDKLAANGILFENAFATAPVCSASRSAFITGVHQTTLGANNHRTLKKNMKSLPDGVKTIGDHFQDHGYFVNFEGKKDLNFKYKGTGLKKRKLSERKPGQPFFTVLQTYHTHRPFKIESKNPIDPSLVTIPPYYPDQPLTRRDWANYLEDINTMDQWVGEQLKFLEENKLLENTIVVFMGDHGRPMVRAKQFLYDSGLKVPLVISYPDHLKPAVNNDLVSLLDLPKTMYTLAGIEYPKVIGGVDMFSEKNKFLIGARGRSGEAVERIRSLRTKEYLLIKNEIPEKSWMQHSSYKRLRYPVYTLMHFLHKQGKLDTIQSMYMKSSKPQFELYDVKNDPYQIKNLANKLPKIVTKLDKQMSDWQEKNGDTILDPDRFDMEDKIKSKDKWASGWYQERGLTDPPSDEELLNYWLETYKVHLEE